MPAWVKNGDIILLTVLVGMFTTLAVVAI